MRDELTPESPEPSRVDDVLNGVPGRLPGR